MRSPAPLLAAAFAAAALPLAFAQEAAAPRPPLDSTVFDWTRLPVKPTRTGERRDLFDAPTRTLARLESHVTTVKPGEASHPPHRHADEELIIVKEGVLEVNINGQTRTAGPGSMVFFASGDLHGMRNAGDTPATYHVIRIFPRDLPRP